MITKRAHILLKDDRKDLRVQENKQIPWQIKYKGRNGIANVRNISASGMLIETDRAFDLRDECIFSFDSDQGESTYIPQVGRLIWSKKKRFSPNKFLCGIKFVEADAKVLQRMRLRVANGVRRFVKEQRVTSTVGLVLCGVFVALIGFIVLYGSSVYNDVSTANERTLSSANQQALLSQNMTNIYRANEIKLAKADERLGIASLLIEEDKAAIDLFSKELEATKALLIQTESMLIEANDRNIEMSSELQVARASGTAPAAPVRIVSPVLTDGRVDSIEEAKALMSEYRQRLREVKGEVGRIKAEERAARIASVREIESQKLELGNNGFFVKEGQLVIFDEMRYNQLTQDKISAVQNVQANQNVEIDITFVE